MNTPKFHVNFKMYTGENGWIDQSHFGHIFADFSRHFQTYELAEGFISSIEGKSDYKDIVRDYPSVEIGLLEMISVNEDWSIFSEEMLDDMHNYIVESGLQFNDDPSLVYSGVYDSDRKPSVYNPVFDALTDELNNRYYDRLKERAFNKGFSSVAMMEKYASLIGCLDRNSWVFQHATNEQIAEWEEALEAINTAVRLNGKLAVTPMAEYKILSDTCPNPLTSHRYEEKYIRDFGLQEYLDRVVAAEWTVNRLDDMGKLYALIAPGSTRVIMLGR